MKTVLIIVALMLVGSAVSGFRGKRNDKENRGAPPSSAP